MRSYSQPQSYTQYVLAFTVASVVQLCQTTVPLTQAGRDYHGGADSREIHHDDRFVDSKKELSASFFSHRLIPKLFKRATGDSSIKSSTNTPQDQFEKILNSSANMATDILKFKNQRRKWLNGPKAENLLREYATKAEIESPNQKELKRYYNFLALIMPPEKVKNHLKSVALNRPAIYRISMETHPKVSKRIQQYVEITQDLANIFETSSRLKRAWLWRKFSKKYRDSSYFAQWLRSNDARFFTLQYITKSDQSKKKNTALVRELLSIFPADIRQSLKDALNTGDIYYKPQYDDLDSVAPFTPPSKESDTPVKSNPIEKRSLPSQLRQHLFPIESTNPWSSDMSWM